MYSECSGKFCSDYSRRRYVLLDTANAVLACCAAYRVLGGSTHPKSIHSFTSYGIALQDNYSSAVFNINSRTTTRWEESRRLDAVAVEVQGRSNFARGSPFPCDAFVLE